MRTDPQSLLAAVRAREPRALGRAISLVEDGHPAAGPLLAALEGTEATTIGITGPGGAGKSTLVQQLVGQYRAAGRRVGVVAIDPSSPLSGGAILGDRVRMMRHASDPDVVVRSMATRGRIGGLCASAAAAVRLMAYAGCNPVIIETVGVGQAEIDIVRLADLTALVLAPGLGDDIQAMKAGLVELADVLVVNKADQPSAEALAMEMEAILQGTERKLCRTCATEGRGLPELVEALAAARSRVAGDGRLERRRQRCRQAEVLDWALEMVRPQLRAALEAGGPVLGDPRHVAQQLLAAVAPTLTSNVDSSRRAAAWKEFA